MIFSYKYPVVKFFGDDPEDTDVTEKAGSIKTINTDQEPYEAVISAEGSQFHIIFGSYQNGSFLCIPGWHTGCELSYLDDEFYPKENLDITEIKQQENKILIRMKSTSKSCMCPKCTCISETYHGTQRKKLL